MSKLKPHDYSIRLCYRCRECLSLLWFKFDDIRHETEIVCKECGTSNFIEPIDFIIIKCQYNDGKIAPVTKNDSQDAYNASDFETMAIAGLIRLGHKKTEAKRIVDDHLKRRKKIHQNPSQEFIFLIDALTKRKKGQG